MLRDALYLRQFHLLCCLGYPWVTFHRFYGFQYLADSYHGDVSTVSQAFSRSQAFSILKNYLLCSEDSSLFESQHRLERWNHWVAPRSLVHELDFLLISRVLDINALA